MSTRSEFSASDPVPCAGYTLAVESVGEKGCALLCKHWADGVIDVEQEYIFDKRSMDSSKESNVAETLF